MIKAKRPTPQGLSLYGVLVELRLDPCRDDIQRGIVGDIPMPLDALLAGFGPAAGSLKADLQATALILLDTDVELAEQLFSASEAPSPVALQFVRGMPAVARDPKLAARLDWHLAAHGHDDAAGRCHLEAIAWHGPIQRAYTYGVWWNLREFSNVCWSEKNDARMLAQGIRQLGMMSSKNAEGIRGMEAWIKDGDPLLIDERMMTAFRDAKKTVRTAAFLKAIEAAEPEFINPDGTPCDLDDYVARAGLHRIEKPAKTPHEIEIDEVATMIQEGRAYADDGLAALEKAHADGLVSSEAVEAQKYLDDYHAAAKAALFDPRLEDEHNPESIQVLDKIDDSAWTAKYGSDNELLKSLSPLSGRAVSLIEAPEHIYERRHLLVERWPHATAVIDRFLEDVRPNVSIRLRPTLLVGPPGSGKTSLAADLATFLELPSVVFPCASVADGSFGGTPAQWSTKRVSIPLSTIARENVANPMVVLDEIEKAGRSETNGSLVHALLPMLERHTARAYFETGIERPSNLSWVNFVATANSLEGIPPALRDRFRIMEMPNPEAQHIGDLSRIILDRIRIERHTSVEWVPPLVPDEIDIIKRAWGGGSLRRLRRAVEATLTAREAFSPRH